MTRMDDQISMKGAEGTIHRDTGSSTDNYGDITPIWGDAVATEDMWLHHTTLEGRNPGVPGILDDADYLIFLKSTTVAQDLDLLKIGSAYYEAKKVQVVKMYDGSVSHYEAQCRLSEEG